MWLAVFVAENEVFAICLTFFLWQIGGLLFQYAEARRLSGQRERFRGRRHDRPRSAYPPWAAARTAAAGDPETQPEPELPEGVVAADEPA